MNTVRALIEGFVYEHIEYFASLIDRDGEDAVFQGIRVLDDGVGFVHGMLVDATAALYTYYVENTDPRAEETFLKLNKFIRFATKGQCKTWGKIAILRALSRLNTAGLLDKLDADLLAVLKEKTEYTDFFDKEKVCTLGYATNYVQVAMACAGYREELGWDTDHYSDVIKDKLMEIMQNGSDMGWMDEQPPHGRFDRYSIIVSSEISDNFEQFGKELPDSVRSNLKDAAEMVLFMANKQGDGINYGRSLSCHGDSTALEILSSALARGLLDESQYDRAVAYSIHILEKILGFWYNKQKKSFDIWWDGRNTNTYRGVHRVLEVNMDMAIHLLLVLRNFEQARLADYQPRCDIHNPKKWEAKELRFIDDGQRVAKTLILRRGDTMSMLPFVGLGNLYKHQAYMPYPAICGRVEGSPEGHLPFLVPEFVLEDGRTVRPIQYYSSVETTTGKDLVTVTAKGNLCVMQEQFPTPCEEGFTCVFYFKGNKIEAEFSLDCAYQSCRMLIGTHKDDTCIEAIGFDDFEAITTDNGQEFHTPHGAITIARLYCTSVKSTIGYRITL